MKLGRPRLHTCSGAVRDGSLWDDEPSGADHRVLDRCRGPVLDVGCGPARHTLALAEKGVPALGLDITGPMLAVARPKGVAVLERSVFDRVPATGRWGTVLLLDGNIGIGGDPDLLLRRVRDLLAPGGLILVELIELDASIGPHRARIEINGQAGPWFGWVSVGADDIASLATRAGGLAVRDIWGDEGRTFAEIEHDDAVD